MDKNLIISIQETGAMHITSGGVELASVDGLRLAIGMARTATDFLIDALVEAKVKSEGGKNESVVEP